MSLTRKRKLDIDEVVRMFARFESLERNATLDLVAVAELRATFESFKTTELAAFDARIAELERQIAALVPAIGFDPRKSS